MGVHQLWEIVGPSARPVRLEALRNKRLAVDASIWIYQFLKAVRDSEGNQLKNSHIVGFFRRICKLLYFGIKPVFVFDGGVPALKKQTIKKRKEKRESNKETIQQTAQKILSRQLQDFADGKVLQNRSSEKNSASSKKTTSTRREIPTDQLYFNTYYDDLIEENNNEQTDNEDAINKGKESKFFQKQDDYDLPNLENGINVDKNDNRLMTDYEYERLTKDISDGLDEVDLDNIDPQSAEFSRLPLSTQYIVLSHLRLRSRLRMGYTKDQLQEMFSDPMEFSKFQIQMVQKRNYLTQKIINATGMDDTDSDVVARRIAGDKNRAYDLKRTGDGYALTIVKPEDNNLENPILLNDDKEEEIRNKMKSKIVEFDSDSGSESVDWDDVEIINEEPIKSANKETSTLFVEDNTESSSDESISGIEMEEVPLEKKNNDSDVMAQIKYLYEYSNKYNKKTKPETASKNHKVVLKDDDIDEYHEMQVQKFEEEELREAIERSKKDYMQSLNEEKSGIHSSDNKDSGAPIILSTSTLAKTLNLSNLSMANNLLFGGTAKKTGNFENKLDNKISNIDMGINGKEDQINKNEELEKEKDSKKKIPLPDWFSNQNNFDKPEDGTHKFNPTNITEDEKAGLISYVEAKDYFSSDESDVEFVEVQQNDSEDDKIAFKNKNISNQNNEEHPILIDENNIDGVNEIVNELVIEKKSNLGHNISSQSVDDTQDASGNNVEKTVIRTEVLAVLSPKVNEEKKENKINIPEIEEEKTDSRYSEAKNVTVDSILVGNRDKEPQKAGLDDYEFSDDEEVDLMLNMEEENNASNSFFNKIKSKDQNGTSWGFDDEANLQEALKKQKRDADEVSTDMIYDVQELLSRFGIPFITSPMEAEAQCAELKLLQLVDGIITDDSDCFLFGGDRIYKNLFNDKHFVECYQIEDVEYELGLGRDKFIELAILLGSDYTEGVKGVGKVMAMEILAEFKNLENFKKWWIDYQNGQIDQSNDTVIRKKIRKTLKNNNFFIHEGSFPNKLIYEAYLRPEVDHDKTEFKWGYPDLDKLRTFLRYNVGWNKEKVDEVLLPVIKNLNKPQSTIEEFFPVEMIQRQRQLNLSKRIKSATDKIKSSKKQKL